MEGSAVRSGHGVGGSRKTNEDFIASWLMVRCACYEGFGCDASTLGFICRSVMSTRGGGFTCKQTKQIFWGVCLGGRVFCQVDCEGEGRSTALNWVCGGCEVGSAEALVWES